MRLKRTILVITCILNMSTTIIISTSNILLKLINKRVTRMGTQQQPYSFHWTLLLIRTFFLSLPSIWPDMCTSTHVFFIKRLDLSYVYRYIKAMESSILKTVTSNLYQLLIQPFRKWLVIYFKRRQRTLIFQNINIPGTHTFYYDNIPSLYMWLASKQQYYLNHVQLFVVRNKQLCKR